MVENAAISPCLEGSDASSSESQEPAVANDKNIDMIYLNNAGMARLSPEVQAVGVSVISRQGGSSSSPAAAGVVQEADPALQDPSHDCQGRVRQLFAELLEAKASEIAIMPSTAFAMTLAAKNLQRQLLSSSSQDPPKRILVLADQMCSAVYPWQDICESSQGRLTLDIVPYPKAGETWTDVILKRLEQDDVAVACLPPLHWSDGAPIDLIRISRACFCQGVILLVDATQAIAAAPFSVKDMPHVTMVACSVHKWLRGPSGHSLVYINPNVYQHWEPLDQHGRSRDLDGGENWDAAKNEMGPNGYPVKFFDDARKFDSGGKPNPILLPMLQVAMEQVVQLDLHQVQKQLRTLMGPLCEWAAQNGYSLPPGSTGDDGDGYYHIVGIRPVNKSPQEMVQICSWLQEEKGIHIAVRCGVFRVSPYIDNTDDDIAALISALSSVKDSL